MASFSLHFYCTDTFHWFLGNGMLPELGEAYGFFADFCINLIFDRLPWDKLKKCQERRRCEGYLSNIIYHRCQITIRAKLNTFFLSSAVDTPYVSRHAALRCGIRTETPALTFVFILHIVQWYTEIFIMFISHTQQKSQVVFGKSRIQFCSNGNCGSHDSPIIEVLLLSTLYHSCSKKYHFYRNL